VFVRDLVTHYFLFLVVAARGLQVGIAPGNKRRLQVGIALENKMPSGSDRGNGVSNHKSRGFSCSKVSNTSKYRMGSARSESKVASPQTS
jgi:hypothetical protein